MRVWGVAAVCLPLLVLGCGDGSRASGGRDGGSVEASAGQNGGSSEAGDDAQPAGEAGGPAARGCITDVALDADSLCALRSDGTVWCWGYVPVGAAGKSSATPMRIRSLGSDVVELSGGLVKLATIGAAGHMCARKADGTLRCWNGNFFGESDSEQGLCGSSWCAPVRGDALGAPVAAVSLGGASTCAVLADGALWCWGGKYSRQSRTAPLPLVRRANIGPDIVGMADASWALEANGALWWLPLGASDPDGDPLQVAPAGSDSVEIAATSGDGIAFRHRDYRVYAVGSDRTLRRGELHASTGSFAMGQPIAREVRHVATGYGQICIIKTDGTLWCDTSDDGSGVQLSQVPGSGSNVVQVALGYRGLCARKSDDTLWCNDWSNPAPTQVVIPCPSSPCPAGSADCDGDLRDGCETQRLDDGNNCGACGHSCKGGACIEGVCGPAPTRVHRFAPPAGIYNAPPRALEVDDQYVYVLDGSYTGAVAAFDKSSGAGTTIQSGGVDQIGLGPDGLLFSYRNNDADLLQQWQSGATTTLYSRTPACSGFDVPYHSPVADASAVYFFDPASNSLERYDFGAGALTRLDWGGAAPIALGASQVVVSHSTQLRIVPKRAGNPITVFLPDRVQALAVDASYAYAGLERSLVRVALADGAVTTLARGLDVSDVAVDAGNVYARATLDEKPGSRIVVFPKGRGAVQTLAQLHANYSGAGPRRMAIDATDIYYLDGWSLMKIAK